MGSRIARELLLAILRTADIHIGNCRTSLYDTVSDDGNVAAMKEI